MKKLLKFLNFEQPSAEEYAQQQLDLAKLKVAQALDAKAYAQAMIEYRRQQIEIYTSVLDGSAFVYANTSTIQRGPVDVRPTSGSLPS
jgi:hypothetical protein